MKELIKRLQRCPFCGSDPVTLVNILLDTYKLLRIVCFNDECKIQTPWHSDENKLREAWNKRINKQEST